MTAVDSVVCRTWYIDQMEVDIQCGHLQNVSLITSLFCTGVPIATGLNLSFSCVTLPSLQSRRHAVCTLLKEEVDRGRNAIS